MAGTDSSNFKRITRPTRVFRFAHPFFTTTPVPERPQVARHGTRMLDHIQGTLHDIPPLKRNNGQWTLDEVIGKDGADAIKATGKITIHLAGDTGVPETDHETMQVLVAAAMALDYSANAQNTVRRSLCILGTLLRAEFE